jgi:signal transduction histidine kinase
MNKDVGAITKRGANWAAKTGKTGSMRPSRRFVAVAFALVAAWVPVVTLFAVFQALSLQRRTHEIADTVLTSVRLVGRLENEVEKKQTLIDEHILATDFAEMAGLEARLAVLDQQIAVTTQSYEPWATLPGERTAWDETRADLKALDPPISHALALSRQNRDVEARKVMQLVAGQFAAVGAQFDKLISINDQGAAETLAQFSRIQLRLRLTLLGMGVISLAGVVLVWRWAARQVGRREAETAREAKILEEQNRELDAFAGRVAHDIRNPLMAINIAATQLTRKVPEETWPRSCSSGACRGWRR